MECVAWKHQNTKHFLKSFLVKGMSEVWDLTSQWGGVLLYILLPDTNIYCPSYLSTGYFFNIDDSRSSSRCNVIFLICLASLWLDQTCPKSEKTMFIRCVTVGWSSRFHRALLVKTVHGKVQLTAFLFIQMNKTQRMVLWEWVDLHYADLIVSWIYALQLFLPCKTYLWEFGKETHEWGHHSWEP